MRDCENSGQSMCHGAPFHAQFIISWRQACVSTAAVFLYTPLILSSRVQLNTGSKQRSRKGCADPWWTTLTQLIIGGQPIFLKPVCGQKREPMKRRTGSHAPQRDADRTHVEPGEFLAHTCHMYTR